MSVTTPEIDNQQPTTNNQPILLLSSLIGHARELLVEILDRPAIPADGTINRFFRDRRYLGSRDRGYIAETVYGTLRGVLRLRFLMGPELRRATIEQESAVLLAAYLLEAGEADRGAIATGTGLATPQLVAIREVLDASEASIDALSEPLRSAVRFGLPVWFVEKLAEQIEPSDRESLLASLNRQAPITLRANRLRATREQVAGALRAQGIPSTPGKYAPDALLLEKRINANAAPGFKEGWFELQDEGSQLLSVLIDPHPNWRVFDACAGAGGKSLHLSAIMKGKGEIVAHDVNRRRLAEIRPRLKRSGAQNIRVMEPETYRSRRDTLAGTFHAVIIDAPCSGTGVLRRNPGSRLTMDEEMLGRVTRLQSEILDEYSALVRPAGLLLYATCSLLREENEEQVTRFLAAHREFTLEPIAPPEGMFTLEGFFRCYPHRHDTDGFFGALMRRRM
jgi:16S rRNA (cytosine967-C5)-methyltransferase